MTALPLAALWGLAWVALSHGLWWAAMLLTLPAAGFLVRLFMIQHDCGHGSFFPWKAANDWAGRIIGIVTLTPYEYWRATHAMHHATSGNLDRRGLGVIEMLTVEEYRAMPAFNRLLYRLYRNPAVMFGLGPGAVFFFMQRLPFGMMKRGWRPWASTVGNGLGIAAVFGGLMWWIGTAPILLIHALTMLIAATIGVWLFYIQHQYEGVSWARNGQWRAQEAALNGSSYYRLPGPLQWLTANIGIHHVHHLSSRIPFYRLSEVMRDYPELAAAPPLKIGDSLRSARLALWDEAGQRLVSFRQLRDIP